MKISRQEQIAIIEVLAYGEAHGYGNLISHLQTAWAKHLIGAYGMDEKTARASTGRDGAGYPFRMQQDLIERGEWDETGARYHAPQKRKSRSTVSSGRREDRR
jgi:hypothetical protein